MKEIAEDALYNYFGFLMLIGVVFASCGRVGYFSIFLWIVMLSLVFSILKTAMAMAEN